ncbi:hypothetical protein AB1N83_010359 [Pleurotus pulmonarius]
MISMSDPVDLISVETLRGLNLSTYISVSSTAFLVVPVHINPCTASGLTSRLIQIYDYLLMLGSEVQHVWHVNWGAGKVLYLLSRYPLLIASAVALHRTSGHIVPTTECRVLYSVSGYAWVFALVTAEAILAIRVWVLWYRMLWLGVYFACAAVAAVTIALVDVTKAVRSVTYVSDFTSIESLSYPGCLTINEGGKSSYISYIMLVLHGAFVFLLMVIVWYRSFHHSVRFSSMMYTFYTDGGIYFAVMLAISIANMIFNLTQPPEYVNFLFPTQAAVHSVLSTRMLLNLRQSAQRDLSGVNSILGPNTRHRITPIRFAVGVDSTAT